MSRHRRWKQLLCCSGVVLGYGTLCSDDALGGGAATSAGYMDVHPIAPDECRQSVRGPTKFLQVRPRISCEVACVGAADSHLRPDFW